MVKYAMISRDVVQLTSSGTYAPGEWDSVLDAVRNDPAVPDGARLIIDSRQLDVRMSSVQLIDRIKNLARRLGPKMGTACAMVVSPENAVLSFQFRDFAEGLIALRIGVFTEMEDAKRWLTPSPEPTF